MPPPRPFGERERPDSFPDTAWHVLAAGDTPIETFPRHQQGELQAVPGYFVVLAPRHSRSEETS